MGSKPLNDTVSPPPAHEAPSPSIPVTLSSSSIFTLAPRKVFGMAEDLGYDGVEIMVTQNSWTQDVRKLEKLVAQHSMPVHSIHAPTFFFTQQVWGSAWNKVARSADMARELGAEIVVVHPPFRWQTGYADGFAEGVREIAETIGVTIVVENMYPWRVSGKPVKMYLPHHNPIPFDYDHVCWDFSHAAISRADSLHAIKLLGPRLRHLHVTDGTDSGSDEHLIPGDGTQPVAESLQWVGAHGYPGAACVEVSTSKGKYVGYREKQLARALEFTRTNLALGQAQRRQTQEDSHEH